MELRLAELGRAGSLLFRLPQLSLPDARSSVPTADSSSSSPSTGTNGLSRPRPALPWEHWGLSPLPQPQGSACSSLFSWGGHRNFFDLPPPRTTHYHSAHLVLAGLHLLSVCCSVLGAATHPWGKFWKLD